MLAKHQGDIPISILADLKIVDQDGFGLFTANRTSPIRFNPLATPEATQKLFQACINYEQLTDPIREILEYDSKRFIFVGQNVAGLKKQGKNSFFEVRYTFTLTEKEDVYELLPLTQEMLLKILSECDEAKKGMIVEQLEKQCLVSPGGTKLKERPWDTYLDQRYAKEHKAVLSPEVASSVAEQKPKKKVIREEDTQKATPTKKAQPKRAYMIEFSIKTDHGEKYLTLPYKGVLPETPTGWEWKEHQAKIPGISHLYSAELLNAQNVDELPTWSVIKSILASMGYPQSSHEHAKPIRSYLDSFEHFPVPICIVEATIPVKALPKIPATKWQSNFNFEAESQIPTFEAHLLVPMEIADHECRDYLSTL
jgi:hypothetical protein